MKFCVKCKNSTYWGVGLYSCLAQKEVRKFDPVNGTETIKFVDCRLSRYDESMCGSEAKYYTPKLPERLKNNTYSLIKWLKKEL